MEDIEQLKQDNAKLTERLNNAAKFFKDQKAQIDNLTKENKQLKVKIETISSKLCEKCKKLLNKESNEEKKTQFLLSNTHHMSYDIMLHILHQLYNYK